TGQMGNSEVGHLTLGSGCILFQDLVRIDQDISNVRFNKNPRFLEAISLAKKKNGRVHLLGLVSDGGVHSHISHLVELIRLCGEHQVQAVVHMITDGRDTPPRSALRFLPVIEQELDKADGFIGSVVGRYYAMDRDRRWPRTESAWRLFVEGKGERHDTAGDAIRASYENNTTDEFIAPTLIHDDAAIREDDSVICFNFRSDRVRQIAAALTDETFPLFERGNYTPRHFVCMTEYASHFKLPIAYPHEDPPITLADVVSKAGIKQFHCAETEKYAHVTYFFNGGQEPLFEGEERKMIPSPSVETYDRAPAMSANAVSNAVIDALEKEEFGFIVVNYANGDMVGHTAKETSIIKAIETLDKEVDRVIKVALSRGYSIVVTADHGNCEQMVDPVTQEPHTQHTNNPVPCFVFDSESWVLEQGLGLSSIAPTILQLMGLEVPQAMHSPSILRAADDTTAPYKRQA
ncbi:MAG: 2,3-bisphosphoglycerate-independent phosphoglycerate mutase, partial [Gammaproteobacteria bacterium]|nr:2,3-bisphosphoglycerate-independent phosphoglycerate mutase [Gammaproteobacteria bacterium]